MLKEDAIKVYQEIEREVEDQRSRLSEEFAVESAGLFKQSVGVLPDKIKAISFNECNLTADNLLFQVKKEEDGSTTIFLFRECDRKECKSFSACLPTLSPPIFDLYSLGSALLSPINYRCD